MGKVDRHEGIGFDTDSRLVSSSMVSLVPSFKLKSWMRCLTLERSP